MLNQDISQKLQEQVKQAAAPQEHFNIVGGNSKSFYGGEPTGTDLLVGTHRGIVNYEPTELVVTARAGTPLKALQQILSDNQQMFAFEPPQLGSNATLGGTIACNLSGPRRFYAGAARDYVLGTKLLNGEGHILKFGGEVMKNVAGYDVSRLMTGALGTLGLLLEVSLKVQPKPEMEVTLAQSLNVEAALEKLHHWGQQPLPISASCIDGQTLYYRISGSERAVNSAREKTGGDLLSGGDTYWFNLKEQQHPFFNTHQPLWRLAVPSDTPVLDLDGEWLYEWGGAQRWFKSTADKQDIRQLTSEFAGHATLFKNHGDCRDQVFHPLPAGLMTIHRKIKHAMDPKGIFNRSRMYSDI